MPSTYVIAISIAALLIILVAYALIAQHTTKKRKHQQRLTTALRKRLQVFSDYAEGFPEGFLTPELQTLIFKVLLNVSEQLHKLEPRGGHLTNINLYSNALSQKPSPNNNQIQFETPAEINQTRGLLQELGRHISSQAEQGRIAKPVAHALIGQIKALALKITLEGAIQEARKAESEGKTSLALHRYKLCLTLLQKNQQSTAHNNTAAEITGIIKRLTVEAETAALTKDDEVCPWGEESSETDEWKKKQVYD